MKRTDNTEDRQYIVEDWRQYIVEDRQYIDNTEDRQYIVEDRQYIEEDRQYIGQTIHCRTENTEDIEEDRQ